MDQGNLIRISCILIVTIFRNLRIYIWWKPMYQKNTGRGKLASFSSYHLAKKIYSSNRTLEKKKVEKTRAKSNYISINH